MWVLSRDERKGLPAPVQRREKPKRHSSPFVRILFVSGKSSREKSPGRHSEKEGGVFPAEYPSFFESRGKGKGKKGTSIT